MNKMIRQIVSLATAAAISLSGASPVFAQAQAPICGNDGIIFGFFNGVNTTRAQAKSTLQVLRRLYGNKSQSTGEAIHYQEFYNSSAGLEDFVETFEQRLREDMNGLFDGRMELFLEITSGSFSWWEIITDKVTGSSDFLTSILNRYKSKVFLQFLDRLAKPPTRADYEAHYLMIDADLAEGKKLVFFAHSQGNLFVNEAAAHAQLNSSYNAVKIVHVAPASANLSAPKHVLANLDLVINGLRLSGTGIVPKNTDPIPDFPLRPPGLGGGKDFLGHSLLEIYLNPALKISNSVRTLVESAIIEVESPPQRAALGQGVHDEFLGEYDPIQKTTSAYYACYFDTQRTKPKFQETLVFDTAGIRLIEIEIYPKPFESEITFQRLEIGFQGKEIYNSIGVRVAGGPSAYISIMAQSRRYNVNYGSLTTNGYSTYRSFHIDCGELYFSRNISYENIWSNGVAVGVTYGQPGINVKDIPESECPTAFSGISVSSIDYTRYPLFKRYSQIFN